MWLRTLLAGILLYSYCTTLSAQVSFTEMMNGSEAFQITGARGVAVADFDNDGDEDFFITGRPSRLFRNDGQFIFTDISGPSGMDGTESTVAVWADLDNDGWLDLVSSSWTTAHIYLNNGDGTFREGFSPGISRRQALLAGDLNGDGWVDIFSANFRDAHQLLLNAGQGLLIDEAKRRGVASERTGMGGLLVDHDLDGDLDIYLVYDNYEPSEFFENDGEGNFNEVAGEFSLNSKSQGMGIDEADMNGDGFPDYYITNLFDNFLFQSRFLPRPLYIQNHRLPLKPMMAKCSLNTLGGKPFVSGSAIIFLVLICSRLIVCDRTTSEMRGLSPKIISGDSR